MAITYLHTVMEMQHILVIIVLTDPAFTSDHYHMTVRRDLIVPILEFCLWMFHTLKLTRNVFAVNAQGMLQ